MIRINTSHITEDGLLLEGTESSDILGLSPDSKPPVEAAGDIKYHLLASMVGQDLLVMGSAEVKLKTDCVRCLKTVSSLLKASNICLHFEKIGEREVDITDDIREEILLAIPQNFHCSESCQGLCPGCGANLNTESCRCEPGDEEELPPEDSPWNALDALKLK